MGMLAAQRKNAMLPLNHLFVSTCVNVAETGETRIYLSVSGTYERPSAQRSGLLGDSMLFVASLAMLEAAVGDPRLKNIRRSFPVRRLYHWPPSCSCSCSGLVQVLNHLSKSIHLTLQKFKLTQHPLAFLVHDVDPAFGFRGRCYLLLKPSSRSLIASCTSTRFSAAFISSRFFWTALTYSSGVSKDPAGTDVVPPRYRDVTVSVAHRQGGFDETLTALRFHGCQHPWRQI